MSNFEKTALQGIYHHKMLSLGDTVIVALSGGADSVALFQFLLSIKEELKLNVMAVHINHNLRGSESQRDEDFVRELCKNNGVKLFVKNYDVEKIAKESKISTELCGRNLRYNYFKELYLEYSCKIAVAHTASDNSETVLFNLARGGGLRGISGILPVRDYIIRPLIFVTRQQVEEYCKSNNFSYITDSSNLTDDYTRNKIRHNVVPVLKEINPDFDNTVLRSSTLFAEIEEYLLYQAELEIAKCKTKTGYDKNYIDKLPTALKNYVLYTLCKKEEVQFEYRHIELLTEKLKTGGAVNFPNNKRGVVSQNTLRFFQISQENFDKFKMDFQKNIDFCFSGKTYVVKESNKKNLLSPSLLEKGLYFRTRQSGDKFTLPYRNVTKSVKKLFNELKIPAENRDKLLVLTDGSVIYWIENVGVSKQGLAKDNGVEITVTT